MATIIQDLTGFLFEVTFQIKLDFEQSSCVQNTLGDMRTKRNKISCCRLNWGTFFNFMYYYSVWCVGVHVTAYMPSQRTTL